MTLRSPAPVLVPLAWGAPALGIGPGLCKIVHPNFREFLFHALLGLISHVGLLLSRPQLAPELTRAHRFEGGQRAQQPRQDGECGEGGNRQR